MSETTERRKQSMFLAGLCILIFAVFYIGTYVVVLQLAGALTAETAGIMMPVAALAVVGIVLMIVGLCMKRKVKRTTVRVECTNSVEMQRKVSELLEKKGYRSIAERGENVWKCGRGFLTAMKYIKIESVENRAILVSGWVRMIGGNEQDLSGTFACIVPKKQVRKVITEIQSIVS